MLERHKGDAKGLAWPVAHATHAARQWVRQQQGQHYRRQQYSSAHPRPPRCQSAPPRPGPPRSPAQCRSGATAAHVEAWGYTQASRSAVGGVTLHPHASSKAADQHGAQGQGRRHRAIGIVRDRDHGLHMGSRPPQQGQLLACTCSREPLSRHLTGSATDSPQPAIRSSGSATSEVFLGRTAAEAKARTCTSEPCIKSSIFSAGTPMWKLTGRPPAFFR